jgi:membrane protease YdiL (CAAX protease family)
MLIEVVVLFAIVPFMRPIANQAYLLAWLQIGASAVIALPAVIRSPDLLALYRTGSSQWFIGAAALLLALLSAIAIGHIRLVSGLIALLKQLATGFGEETVFRGFVFAKSLALKPRVWFALILSSLLFGIAHVPQVIYEHDSVAGAAAELATDTVIGAVLALVRYGSKALVLPTLLHAAVNLGHG